MKAKVLLLILVFCLWTSTKPVEGEIVVIEFSGVFTSIDDSTGLLGNITDETVFSGTYTYDTATANTSGRTDMGEYVHSSPYGITIFAADFVFETHATHTGQFLLSITDNATTNPHDGYYVKSSENTPLSNGLDVALIEWYLGDITETALASITLPAAAPVLGDWATSQLSIKGPYESGHRTFVLEGVITSATLVPEPCMNLFVLGELVGSIRRTQHKRCNANQK